MENKLPTIGPGLMNARGAYHEFASSLPGGVGSAPACRVISLPSPPPSVLEQQSLKAAAASHKLSRMLKHHNLENILEAVASDRVFQ